VLASAHGRGDLAGADKAFRRAYELAGTRSRAEPCSKSARKAAQALRALELSLESRSWASMQRRTMLLAIWLSWRWPRANGTGSVGLAELDADPGPRDSPALDALVTRARAELAFSEGRRTEAIAALRRAVELWREVGSPFAVGSLRVRLAELLRADGDLETADLSSPPRNGRSVRSG